MCCCFIKYHHFNLNKLDVSGWANSDEIISFIFACFRTCHNLIPLLRHHVQLNVLVTIVKGFCVSHIVDLKYLFDIIPLEWKKIMHFPRPCGCAPWNVVLVHVGSSEKLPFDSPPVNNTRDNRSENVKYMYVLLLWNTRVILKIMRVVEYLVNHDT